MRPMKSEISHLRASWWMFEPSLSQRWREIVTTKKIRFFSRVVSNNFFDCVIIARFRFFVVRRRRSVIARRCCFPRTTCRLVLIVPRNGLSRMSRTHVFLSVPSDVLVPFVPFAFFLAFPTALPQNLQNDGLLQFVFQQLLLLGRFLVSASSTPKHAVVLIESNNVATVQLS
jgi:hypothetical protein